MQKKIAVIITLLNLNFNAAKCSTPSVQLEDQSAPISTLIGKSYLEKRKIDCKRSSDLQKLSVKEKIFSGESYNQSVKMSDVEMNMTSEMCNEEESIIIETKVCGLVGDFENDDVLDNEKRLLKFVLIKAYFDCLKKLQTPTKNKSEPIVVPIDSHTKVTMTPRNLTFTKRNMYSFYETEEVSKEYKGMKFLTVFSAAEFDLLIQKYFCN